MRFQMKSETISPSTSAADTKIVKLDGWKNRRGPTGGRVVIDSIDVRINTQVDESAAATDAAGYWIGKLLTELLIEDGAGTLCKLSGHELRLREFARDPESFDGADAGLAASTNNQVFEYSFRHFFSLPGTLNPEDFAVPAEYLEQIVLEFPGPTTLGVTIDSLSCVLVANCHEEFDRQAHSRMEVRSYTADQLVDLYIPVHGALLFGAYVFLPSDIASGGTALTMTSITCGPLGLSNLADDDLIRTFVADGRHALASTADPFVEETALAIFQARKITEGVQHGGRILVELTGNSTANLKLVTELVTRRTEFSNPSDAKMVGAPVQIKTASKVNRDPVSWAKRGLAAFMPAKIG